jgi:hypothetical protein
MDLNMPLMEENQWMKGVKIMLRKAQVRYQTKFIAVSGLA